MSALRRSSAIAAALVVITAVVLLLPSASATVTTVFSAPYSAASSVTFPRVIGAHGYAQVHVTALPAFSLSNGTASAAIAATARASPNGTVQSLASAEPVAQFSLPVAASSGGHFRITLNVSAAAHWAVVPGACALNASPSMYDACGADASVALFVRVAFLDGTNRSGDRGHDLVLIDNGSLASGFCQYGYCANYTSASLSGSLAVTGTYILSLEGRFSQSSGTVQVTAFPIVLTYVAPFFTTLLNATAVASLSASVTISSIAQW